MGIGRGPKSQMLLQVFKHWGYEAKDDNRADAYGLAAMGLAHLGRLKPITATMREVVGQLRLIAATGCNQP